MEKHKSKALEEGCLCSKCIFRFQCFTQERVFSDPIYQGLFEALIAKGKSREEAIDEVAQEIKNRMGGYHIEIDPPAPNSAPYPYQPITIQPWTVISDHCQDSVSIIPLENGTFQVSYTMLDGEEVSWQCKSQ